MSRVYEGDEWKHARASETIRSRASLQASSNARYATGLISLDEWRREFDKLGEPTRGLIPESARKSAAEATGTV